MGASLTLVRGLMLPLIISAAVAAMLLTALALALASADPSPIVVAENASPFRWT